MDSRMVVGGNRVALHRERRIIVETMLRPVVHSFGHASLFFSPSPSLLSLSPPLSLSLSLFRGSRAAAPKLPEIIGFFCFPVIHRMARSFAPPSIPVPCHFYLSPWRSPFPHILVAFPLSFNSSPFPSDYASATSAAMNFLLLVFLRGERSPSSISFLIRCAYFLSLLC